MPRRGGLKDTAGGREFTQEMQHFPGMPQQPLTREQLREKFTAVTKSVLGAESDQLFGKLSAVEIVTDMGEVV